MSIAACPRCRDEVTVPAGADRSAKVRCPLCSEEYELGEAIDSMPPALILVDASEAAPAANEFEGIAAAMASSPQSAGGFDFAVQESATESAEVEPATPAFTPSPRAKRKQKSAAWEIGKVVGGGVIGLTIGQLLLWWLPLPENRGDPFGLGPKVARFAPWIVPSKFHGAAAGAEQDNDAFNADDNRFLQAVQQAQQNATDQQPGRPTRRPANNPSRTADFGGATAERLFPDVPASALSGVGDLTEPATPENEKPPAASIGSVRGAPVISDLQMVQAIQEAGRAAEAFNSTAGEVPSELTVDQLAALRNSSVAYYQSLAFVAEAITYLDPADEGALAGVETLRSLLADLDAQAGKLQVLSSLSQFWLKKDDRDTSGVFLVGEVTNMRVAGRFFETQLTLLPGGDDQEKTHVTVVSRNNPQESYQPGDRVLMLGAILENPREQLVGYRGKAPQIVLGGFPLKLPAAAE